MAGGCYWAADAYAEQRRNVTVEHGWMVSIWPKVLIEFMHHCLVRDETGALIDPSKYGYGDADTTTFIADNTVVPSRDAGPFIFSKFILLSKKPVVRKFAELSIAQSKMQREVMRHALQQGAFVPLRPAAVRLPPELSKHRTALFAEYDRLLPLLHRL